MPAMSPCPAPSGRTRSTASRSAATWSRSDGARAAAPAAPIQRRPTTMTYCVGVKLEEGLIFASDSRTHAGVDNYAKFCKMTVFERTYDRVLVLLSSGGLAATQTVINVLRKHASAEPHNILTVTSMF